eukprot:m51a1_g3313 putative ribokinase (531) ;mRNA; r:339154-341221
MAGVSIAVVGSSNMDLIAYTNEMPLVGQTVLGRDFKMGFGGKGANQCIACGRLGAHVVMVTKVGQDDFGRTTIENYKRNGVDTQHVSVAPAGVPSGVAQITVDGRGRNVITVVSGANDRLEPADVERARPAIAGCKALLCQLEVPVATTLAALRLGRSVGATTIMNPAPAPTAPLPAEVYELSDVMAPNETELACLSGMPVGSTAEAEAAARSLLARGCRSVVVTLGENGCLWVPREGKAVHVAAPKVAAVDTVGAGDCFLGALAFCLARGDAMQDALRPTKAPAAAPREEDDEADEFSARKRHTRTYTNEDAPSNGVSTDRELHVSHCSACSQYVLITRVPLDSLPRRKTDGSTIVRDEAVLRQNVKDGGTKLLKRANGLERQHRFNCASCGVWVAYRAGSTASGVAPLYVVEGALITTERSQRPASSITEDKDNGGVRISVCVTPASGSRGRVLAVDDDFVVTELAHAAGESDSNDELAGIVAEALEVPQSAVVVSAGAASQWKTLRVRGVDAATAYKNLLQSAVKKK